MELLNELLEIEEKNDIGNLTSSDRAEFQIWVKEALEQKDALDKARGEIENTMKYQYATGDNQYAEGFEKSLEIIDKYSTEDKELTTNNDLEPEKNDYELE